MALKGLKELRTKVYVSPMLRTLPLEGTFKHSSNIHSQPSKEPKLRQNFPFKRRSHLNINLTCKKTKKKKTPYKF